MNNPILWEGRPFLAIERFDGRVVALITEDGGSYFTALPISPLEYRKQNPRADRAFIVISEDENHIYTIFTIYDDWGVMYLMKIPNELEKEIAEAKSRITAEGLLKNSCT